MNRALIFGIATFVAVVGIALVGGNEKASAGFRHHRGCSGSACNGGACDGGCSTPAAANESADCSAPACNGQRHHCCGLFHRLRYRCHCCNGGCDGGCSAPACGGGCSGSAPAPAAETPALLLPPRPSSAVEADSVQPESFAICAGWAPNENYLEVYDGWNNNTLLRPSGLCRKRRSRLKSSPEKRAFRGLSISTLFKGDVEMISLTREVRHLPSPHEIRQICQRIQAAWSPAERLCRIVTHYQPWLWSCVPVADLGLQPTERHQFSSDRTQPQATPVASFCR